LQNDFIKTFCENDFMQAFCEIRSRGPGRTHTRQQRRQTREAARGARLGSEHLGSFKKSRNGRKHCSVEPFYANYPGTVEAISFALSHKSCSPNSSDDDVGCGRRRDEPASREDRGPTLPFWGPKMVLDFAGIRRNCGTNQWA
jgi:hypothetical protein